ncbi:MAG: hypothetical protein ACOX2P_06670 [Bacillota bacterium]
MTGPRCRAPSRMIARTNLLAIGGKRTFSTNKKAVVTGIVFACYISSVIDTKGY